MILSNELKGDKMCMINYKNQLIIFVSTLLLIGFFATSFASYYTSRSSLRTKIKESELPLTADNIYSEIQRDLLNPVLVSSFMATDTFLRDWLLSGEKDPETIRRYLNDIQNKYGTFTSFLVSDKTNIYYHTKGVLKKISPEAVRDKWYYRVKSMKQPYELNVDPNLANKDAMTIFVNYKVFDYENNFIGATGVGLSIQAVKTLIKKYQAKYKRNIYFINQEGDTVLYAQNFSSIKKNISQMSGLQNLTTDILSKKEVTSSFNRDGQTVHLNTRYLPRLKWFLIVEQPDDDAVQEIYNALLVNLAICTIISAIIITLIIALINAYRKKLHFLDAEDQRLSKLTREQATQILNTNEELTTALEEVKHLGGLLPICCYCKKIRDDKGYWNQIEEYIADHTDAKFSHGMCPDCANQIYKKDLANTLDQKKSVNINKEKE